MVGPAGGEAAGGRAGTGVRRAHGLAGVGAIYGVDNLLARRRLAPPEDRSAFNFDPRVIDWPRYITEVHLPSIIERRVKTTPGKTRIDRRAPAPPTFSPTAYVARVRPREHAHRQRGRELLPGWRRDGSTGPSGPARPADHGRDPEPARAGSQGPQRLPPLLLPALRGRASGPARQGLHRAPLRPHHDEELPGRHPACGSIEALGHRTVLITGALDFVVKPLAPLFDEIIAAEMTTKADGTYTGELTAVPPTGEARAQIMADYCEAVGVASRRAWPMPTPRRTCRCWRPSASRGREPRDPPRRDRPQAGVAGRAVVEGAGQTAPAAAHRSPAVGPGATGQRDRDDEGAADRAQPGALRRGAGRRLAGAGGGCRLRAARPRRRRPTGPARTGGGYDFGHGWPASAGATSPPSTARPAVTSNRS